MLLRSYCKQLLSYSNQQTSWRCSSAAFNSTQAANVAGNTVTNNATTTADPDLNHAKPFDSMPGQKGFMGILRSMKEFLPIIGSLAPGKPLSLPEIHRGVYQEYGSICRMDIPGMKQKFVFVMNPDDIRKVFAHEGRYPYRDMLNALTEYRATRPDLFPNKGLLSENYERWHYIRSKVQVSMLKPQITETYIPKMAAVSEDFVNRIKTHRDDKNEVPDFLNELYRWSLESVGLVTFNTRLGCLSSESSAKDSESQKMIQATIEMFEALLELELKNPWTLLLPKKKTKAKMARNQEYILSIATKYCDMTLENMARSKNLDEEDFGIMGQLLQRDDLDVRDIHTLALDLLTAGIETTAHSSAFTLYLLARNMSAQDKVLEEIDRLLPSPDTPITPQIVHQMRWVRASVKEAMRIMPTVQGTVRVLDHEVCLSGYRVPENSILFLVSQIAASLPENFPDADKFLPERWLSSTKPHPYSNLPFGHGPRSCIGKRIALQELHLLIIKMLYKFRVEYHHEDIRLISRLVSMPDRPLRLSFVDRK